MPQKQPQTQELRGITNDSYWGEFNHQITVETLERQLNTLLVGGLEHFSHLMEHSGNNTMIMVIFILVGGLEHLDFCPGDVHIIIIWRFPETGAPQKSSMNLCDFPV